MLATPIETPPEGDGWAFEIKWDGVRALAFLDKSGTRIASRRGEDTTPRYPELAELAAELDGREAILDGEVVAFDVEGHPSFQTLQLRMGLSRPETIRRRAREIPVTYVAFDLLALDGESLLAEPYERRRELLASLELEADHWRSPAHHVGGGAEFLAAARARGSRGSWPSGSGARTGPARGAATGSRSAPGAIRSW